jgi:hypothetical protein
MAAGATDDRDNQGPAAVRWYSLIQPLYRALYSRTPYRDAARAAGGLALGYLLLLVALASVANGLLLHLQTRTYVARHGAQLIEQIPVITVRHGRAEVDAPMPVVVREPQSGAALALIDTGGTITSLDGQEAQLLLTANRLLVRMSASDVRAYELADVDELVIDRALLGDWLGFVATWFAPLVALVMLPVLFVYRFVQALLYAAVGLLLARLAQVTLGYGALARLAVVALTPVVWLDLIAGLLGFAVPAALALAVALGYLYFGIVANRGAGDAVVAA